MSQKAPMSRPSFNLGYIPIHVDGHTYKTRIGNGQTVISGCCPHQRHPCNPFNNMIRAQYGTPCYQRSKGYKPDIYLCDQ